MLDSRRVLFPPLHLKLALVNQFVRALDKESPAFNNLQDFFPKLSVTKVEACFFIGSEIKKHMESKELPKKLTRMERAAWYSFVTVVLGFLESQDRKLCGAFWDLGDKLRQYGLQNVSIFHILDAHLDKIKKNTGSYSEEQCKHFH